MRLAGSEISGQKTRERVFLRALSITYPNIACRQLEYPSSTILFLLTFLIVSWQIRPQWAWFCSFKRSETPKAKVPRLLKPKTADDCQACRVQNATPCPELRQPAQPRPWSEVKGRRGRKKTISTEGYACNYRDCDYYHVMEAAVHALVGYGCPGHYSFHLDGWDTVSNDFPGSGWFLAGLGTACLGRGRYANGHRSDPALA